MEQDVNQKNTPAQDIASDPETEIRKLVNRHIQNKDDIISEEEFRNLKVGVSVSQEIPEQTRLPQNSDESKDETVEKTATDND